MANRTGVQREEEEVAGEMSFWGSVVSACQVGCLQGHRTTRPHAPLKARHSRLGKHTFFSAVEIAVLKNFYLF